MRKIVASVVCMMTMFAALMTRADSNDLWAEYEKFASDRWVGLETAEGSVKKELARKRFFADTFYGKQITLTGEFKSSGKAVMGGTYVSIQVGNTAVKVMARPSEKSKLASFSAGDRVTFTGTFKSRGDALHGVTFEDGVFAAGDSAPVTDNASPAVDASSTEAIWTEYKTFASDRWSGLETARGAAKKELARKKYFADNFYGKTVVLTGTVNKSGKAIMGGTYLSITVDGMGVKFMMRPSEKAKLSSLSRGDQVTVSGTFKSRGDLNHGVTFEDGVLR